jgi:hypothetical protein
MKKYVGVAAILAAVLMLAVGTANANKDAGKDSPAKANAKLVKDGKYKQVLCPIKGKKVNPKHTLEVAGVKVGFC